MNENIIAYLKEHGKVNINDLAAGLDMTGAEKFSLLVKEIFNIIKEINESGTTVLLVEQNANMALSIADKAYVLETGRIALAGTAQELASSEAVRKAYLGG